MDLFADINENHPFDLLATPSQVHKPLDLFDDTEEINRQIMAQRRFSWDVPPLEQELFELNQLREDAVAVGDTAKAKDIEDQIKTIQ